LKASRHYKLIPELISSLVSFLKNKQACEITVLCVCVCVYVCARVHACLSVPLNSWANGLILWNLVCSLCHCKTPQP